MDDGLRYSMTIRWSVEDRAYVVILPEWEGRALNPVTHGETYDQAVRNGVEAIEALVSSTRKHGDPLPAPSVLGHVA